MQLLQKTAPRTWGTGAPDAIMERASCLDFGENHGTGRIDWSGKWKKGLQ